MTAVEFRVNALGLLFAVMAAVGVALGWYWPLNVALATIGFVLVVTVFWRGRP